MGIRRGMPLGSAHRLAPEAVFLDPDPRRDAETLEQALECLGRFSPGIAGVVDSADPAFGLIELQVDGLERLWGPEPMLLGRIVETLAPILPGRPRAGVAGTRFAATLAAATSGGELVSVPPDDDAAFLAPLAAGLLTPDLDIRARLARFGLDRIGAVGELPRSALIARFGDEGARMHARANGEELVPFRPRRAPERLRLALPIEPGVEDLEPLRFVFRRLVAALADQLLARGVAATSAHLRLELDPAFAPKGTPSSLTFEQRLPEPTAEAEAIERLLYAQLERTPPPAPVIRLELELADVGPAAGQQLPLFVPQAVRAGRLNWQLARLALAFGEDRIRRVELTDPEAPLPETRWRWIPIESGALALSDGEPRATAHPHATTVPVAASGSRRR
ncbi:MAG TPA: DNA polymerase Y family protein [Candidatus Saccharimonadales bacterium]|nr:DNA polymerase Y family protein [Candidatus Saccharimonadales bacterium]